LRIKTVSAIAAGVATLLLLFLWLQPKVAERLAPPEPRAAWVGIQVEGTTAAVVGRVEIEAGQPFELHAVLEARTRSGETIYYSEATELRFGDELVDPDRVLPWDQRRRVQVLWFTVEGSAPYVVLQEGDTLAKLSYGEFFHPEWSTQWAVDGALDSRFADQIEDSMGERRNFGVQHFQAWIEIFDKGSPLVPAARFKSWGASEMLEKGATFASVRAVLPDAPVASGVFGLPFIELPEASARALVEEASRLSRNGVLSTRLLLLRDIFEHAGLRPEEADWQRVDLAAGPAWPGVVGVGDLIQSSGRIVVLYRDEGERGRLDLEDLCFDFDRGASIRRLSEIFSGEGEVDWLQL